jgi:hypothetical protein
MRLFLTKANLADRAVFGAITAIESPNAVFVLYAMFAMIIAGGFAAGVFQNVF